MARRDLFLDPRPQGVRRLALALVLVSAPSCAGAPEPTRMSDAHTDEAPRPEPSERPRDERPTRILLGAGEPSPLPLAVEPAYGEDAALLVWQAPEEPRRFVRWIDAAGVLGPLIALDGENVVLGFKTSTGQRALLTSDGESLCVTRFVAKDDSGRVDAHGCEKIGGSTKLAAVSGDRIALFSIEPVGATSIPEKPETKPEPKPEPKAKKGPPKKSTSKKSTSKKATSKKSTSKKSTPKKPPPRPASEVMVRWASSDGHFDAEATPTGLQIVTPLDGMGLVDARARAEGIWVAWYETAVPSRTKKRAAKGPPSLGWTAISAAQIGPDGKVDPKSRRKVVDGELDWGTLRGFYAPRFVVGKGLSLLGQAGARGGPCEIRRIGGGTRTPSRATCAIDPSEATPAPAIEAIVSAEPRRAAGQLKGEPERVVWAGDRSFFTTHEGTKLFSAGRDGTPREESARIEVLRPKLGWARIFRDGSAAALVGSRVVTIDKAGKPSNGLSKEEIFPAGRRSGAVSGVARIGDTIWVGRGDVGRVSKAPAMPAELAGRADPEGAALVGGASRGLLIELSGGRLHVTGLSASGALASPALSDGRPRSASSPVRPGFVAVERAGGGAIVAGPAAQSEEEIVAFAIDARGRIGPLHSTSLRVRPLEVGWHLSPLPGGGALLTDAARKKALWLSDDGEEIAAAPWPEGEAEARCVDGSPGKTFFPSPKPGTFAKPKGLGEPSSCVLGDPAWAADGSLRWIAISSAAEVEARIAYGLANAVTLPATDPSAEADAEAVRASAPRPCPPEMVLAGGKLCVDRFEATILDAASGEPLSPDYPVTPNLMEIAQGDFATNRWRAGSVHARAMPLPILPQWQRGQKLDLVAWPRRLERPNGYLTGLVAESACTAAGKRLCTLPEFVMACRGEHDTPFPYGDTYVEGVCNVFRESHPAAELHDNASIGHLDPRLNRVHSGKTPLFRRTGATPACVSRWGDDGIYDMVGNLDEWVSEGNGAFAGGFYARSTRSGCDAVVTAHPRAYLDYSTGVRCCKDAAP